MGTQIVDHGKIKDLVTQSLHIVHSAEPVGRRTREARGTRGTDRTRQFNGIDTQTCVGIRGAPACEPVALDEIDGIPVDALRGRINRFYGEPLRHLRTPANNGLDASDGYTDAAWGGRTIQLDGDNGAHARGDISVGRDTNGITQYLYAGADEHDTGITKKDDGKVGKDIRKGVLADVHGAIDEVALRALDTCDACLSHGTGGAEGGACGTEGARGTREASWAGYARASGSYGTCVARSIPATSAACTCGTWESSGAGKGGFAVDGGDGKTAQRGALAG